MNATVLDDGSVIVRGKQEEQRDFMISITEANPEEQQEIVDALYEQTQRIILLVRDRLEREKPFESMIAEMED